MTVPPDDAEALAALTEYNSWMRSFLCTLARRGTQIRRESPGRYDALIEALSPWPWFKGGQFLFDLLEVEDFMADGPAPPILPTAFDGVAWERLRAQLGELKSMFDGAASTTSTAGEAGGAEPAGPQLLAGIGAGPGTSALWTGALPPLEPGLYLYRDVAVGALVSAGPFLQARRASSGDTGDD